MSTADIPPGTIFALLTFRVDRTFPWDVNLYRKEGTAGKPQGYRVHPPGTILGSDSAQTLWGARYMARKLYWRYLRRRKYGNGETLIMMMGKE